MRIKRGQSLEAEQATSSSGSGPNRRGRRIDRNQLRSMDYNSGAMALSPEATELAADGAMAGRAGSMINAAHNQIKNPRLLARVAKSAEQVAKSKSFRITRYGGRIFLIVAIGMDAYEVYTAEDVPAKLAEKAGGWTGAAAATTTVGKVASPLLAGGPFGWIAYGTLVSGAGILGYIAGSKAGEVVYEAGSQIDFKRLDMDSVPEGLIPDGQAPDGHSADGIAP